MSHCLYAQPDFDDIRSHSPPRRPSKTRHTRKQGNDEEQEETSSSSQDLIPFCVDFLLTALEHFRFNKHIDVDHSHLMIEPNIHIFSDFEIEEHETEVNQLNQGIKISIWNHFHATALLKTWFAKRRQPLIPFEFYHEFVFLICLCTS